MKTKKFDKKEFADLLEQNKGIIHKVSLLYTQNQADREDLYQDICLQMWKSFSSYREEAKFSTWLYRVAINTAISQVRKRKNRFLPLDNLNENFNNTGGHEKDDRAKLLFKAISKLNTIDKAIIMLWLEEKKYEDIAEILGISKSNVSVKLVRIKRNLSDIIKSIER